MDIKIQVNGLSEPMDSLERNRHVFRKGRLEFLGGPTCYEQGHGIEGFENQNRKFGYSTYARDRMADELQVDVDQEGY